MWIKKSILLFFSTLVSIYLVELFLSINHINKLVFKNIKVHKYCIDSKNCDTRSASKLYEDTKKNKQPILPSFTPVYEFQKKNFQNYKLNNGKEIFPLSKISNQMTSMCNEAGEWIIYKTDHFGFNNYVKDYNNADIITLGDSYVEGHCSKPENNIAGQIEKITNLKIVNLGLAGSGPLILLATLKEYAVKFKPKNIVWYHFHNDIVNLQRYEKNNDILKNYLNIPKFEQNLISRQDEIDKVIKKYIYKELDKDIFAKDFSYFAKDFSYKTLSKFWYIRKLLKDNNIINTIGLSNKIIQPDINDFNTFERILIKAKKISLDNQINLYFIFLPDISGVYPKNFKHFENEDSRPKVMALAKKYFGNKSLDITDQLVLKFKNKNDLFVGGIQGNHYTDEGYRFVAEQTLKLINNN